MEKEAEEPKKPKSNGSIALNERKSLAPKDSSELARVIEFVNAGKGFPARFDTEAKRIAAYNLANSLMGERWQLAINNIADIKGQLTIFGELPGALAEQTKEVQEKKVYCIDSGYNEICVKNKNLKEEVWGAVCVIQRKGREKKEFFYTLDEAKKAGQYPARRKDGSISSDSPWMRFTKVMLMRKAMAMAIKFEFPDAMVGVPVAEYDFDVAPDVVPVRDVADSTVAEELNSYGKEAQTELPLN